MEGKQKFLPTLVNKIKYTKKVRVADIKTYLVDEFKLAKELNNENKKLKQVVKKAEIINQKYDLTLITLEEYKDRIKDKNKEIDNLESEIKKLKENINLLTNERNDLKLKTKNIDLQIDKIKKDAIKNFKKYITQNIKNAKGHLTKDIVVEIVLNCFDEIIKEN